MQRSAPELTGADEGASRSEGRGNEPDLRTLRYRHTLEAGPAVALEAVLEVVHSFGYIHEGEATSNHLHFSASRRLVTVRVTGAAPGRSTIHIEIASPAWQATGGSTMVILPSLVLGALIRAEDAYFARGFLENVQRVLKGKALTRDPSRFPGMASLRDLLDVGEV